MSIHATSAQNRQSVAGLIRDVPDWPRAGVLFKDVTPLLADSEGFTAAVVELTRLAPADVDVVVGMEARGFIFGAPVAMALGAGFVPVRKPGKLPRTVVAQEFAFEYGTDTLTMHADALAPGARVLIVDDVLATGGTVGATAALVRGLGADLVGVAVLMELAFLGARRRLAEQGIERIDPVLVVEG